MAKRQLEPLYTRWVNLAASLRQAKGNMDFGEIDPKKSANEQQDDNETAVMMNEMIADMRSVATELGGYFDIYLQEQINEGVAKAMQDPEAFQKMVMLLMSEGKLDNVVAQAASAAPVVEEEPETDEDGYTEEELAELEADDEFEVANESSTY